MRVFMLATLLFSAQAFAVTPVYDAPLASQQYQQLLHQYQLAMQQLEMLRQQYEHMQRLERQTTGSGGLGNLFTDPLVLDNLPSDLAEVALFLKASPTYQRNRYAFPQSADPVKNKYYDLKAAGITATQLMYERSQARSERVENLRQSINAQTDPSTKAELSNRMAAEIAAIQVDNSKLELLQQQLDMETKETRRAGAQSSICKKFYGDTKPCP